MDRQRGRATDTADAALEMAAERAALYLVLGLSEQLKKGRWRVSQVAGSRYQRLNMLTG